jgi:predicted nucleic acid-binding Zn ribbon protein
MKHCPSCGQALPEINRYCTRCGTPLDSSIPRTAGTQDNSRATEQLNLNILYGMVAILVLSLLIPPWESPPSQPAAFLGFHFILSPPQPDAIVSRILLTVELTTTAIAGLYLSFLFRRR